MVTNKQIKVSDFQDNSLLAANVKTIPISAGERLTYIERFE